MKREKYIVEIVEALRHSQRATCGKISCLPGAAITPAQWGLLSLVAGGRGASVKELSTTMRVSRSAVTQLVNELVNKGYVRRTTSKSDKRAILISPTPKCDRVISDLQRSFYQQCSRLFSALSDNELRTLRRLHQKVATGLHD